MTFHKSVLAFTSLTMLACSPVFAQSDEGTTLAGGDNGQAAKKSETKKSGGMMKSNGGMMKSGDGMKKDGAMQDGAMKGGEMKGDMPAGSTGNAPMSGDMSNGK